MACTRSPAPPSFERDVLPVMVKQCASGEGCHGPAPTDSVRLDLRPDTAYGQLVGVPSEAREGWLRVAAGNPDASFLLDKLRGQLQRGEGKPMPIDVDTGAPLEPSPLPAGYVDQVLVPWIRAGASR